MGALFRWTYNFALLVGTAMNIKNTQKNQNWQFYEFGKAKGSRKYGSGYAQEKEMGRTTKNVLKIDTKDRGD